MRKQSVLLAVLAVIVLFTACIDSTTTIAVRKDGSGTITERVFVSQSFQAMMGGMFGGEADEEEQEEGEEGIDVEKYRGKAAHMGEGVTFVSARKITGKDGAEGEEIIYAFDDVRTILVDAEPDNPAGDDMAGMMGAEEAEEEEDESPIRFDFIKGGKPKLIIYMPQDREEDAGFEEEEEMEEEADDAMSEAGLAMMKPFLQDFRIRIQVTFPDAGIDKTNASFAEKIGGVETVTLIDMALGEMLDNPEDMKKLEKMSAIKDMSKAMEAMKEIPGLKIETQEKVEVQIK